MLIGLHGRYYIFCMLQDSIGRISKAYGNEANFLSRNSLWDRYNSKISVKKWKPFVMSILSWINLNYLRILPFQIVIYNDNTLARNILIYLRFFGSLQLLQEQ